MRVELQGTELHVDGFMASPRNMSVDDFKKALAKVKSKIVPGSHSKFYLLFLGAQEDCLTSAGQKFWRETGGSYEKLQKKHLRGSIQSYWDIVVQAGFRPCITNASLPKTTGYFISVK